MTGILGFLPFVLAVAIICLARISGVWIKLGGHLFWSGSATFFGIGIGGVAAGLLWRTPGFGVIVFLALLCAISFAASNFGKADLVGSYAENGFAGRIWYYGFIVLIGTVFSGIVVVFNTLTRST